MTSFSIEKQPQPQLNYFDCPRWADVLAKTWLILLALLNWAVVNQPRAEVFVLSRIDLAGHRLTAMYWRVDWAIVVAGAAIALLWQGMVHSLFIKGVAICVA